MNISSPLNLCIIEENYDWKILKNDLENSQNSLELHYPLKGELEVVVEVVQIDEEVPEPPSHTLHNHPHKHPWKVVHPPNYPPIVVKSNFLISPEKFSSFDLVHS